MSNQDCGSEQNLRQKPTAKKRQQNAYFSTQIRINTASNFQHFVENYFPAITECSLCGMDA